MRQVAPPSDGLIGREQETDLALRLLDAVARGSARSLFFEGEAGIGKTALVDTLAEAAALAGVAVVRGGAHPLDQNRAFGVVADALDLRTRSTDPRRAGVAWLLQRADGSEPPGGSVPTSAHHRVVEEITAVVETLCTRAPLLVVLEDLHWADDSSISAVASVIHAVHHVPLFVLGTLRPAPRNPSLAVLLDDCVAHGAHLVRLQSLCDDAVEDLVTTQLGNRPGPVLASIVERAAGNPLWITEILRSLSVEGWLRRDADSVEAMADELPGSFRELVLRRLGYFPSAALELLQVVSVLGDAVSMQDLATVTGRRRSDLVTLLEEAFRSKLLDEHDDAVAFRHQLLQQAIYEDLPRAKRRALHRDAAEAFARTGADLAVVASHLIRGADRGDLDAVALLRRAASEAAASAPAIAVELVSHARSLIPAGHADTDVVAAELADAMLQAGQVADAAELAEAVIDRPHREDVDVDVRLTLVSALSLLNRPAELIDRAEAALRAATLEPAQQALVLTQASYGRTFSRDFVGGEATARRAVDVAEQARDTAMAVWSLCALSVAVKNQGRFAEAVAMAEQAVSRAFDPIHAGARLRHPHFFLAMALADSDRVDEAREAYRRAIEEAEALGTGWLLPDILQLSGEAHLLVGEWDDAAAELEAGVALGHRHGQRISIAQTGGYLALMAAARGDLEAAGAALSAVDAEISGEAPVYGSEVAAFAAAVVAEAVGEPRRAFAVLLRFWDLDLEREARYYHRWFGPPLVRLAVDLGEADVAAQVVASLAAGAELAPEVPTVQSAASRCRGLLERDPVLLLEAVGDARRGGRVIDHAGACEDAAAVLVAARRPAEAKDLLLDALATYERVDARAWAARVAASLRPLGVRRGAAGVRRRPATGPGSLTTSEHAVAQLVVRGLTNREVARQLHISPHTVNTHLRHVFQKLSVATRTELAVKLATRPDHAIE